MGSIGKHLIIDFYQCENKGLLNNKKELENLMETASILAKSTIIKKSFHKFKPQGVTGIVIVAESHLAIHTYPEYNYAAVDIFTCGKNTIPENAFHYLKEKLKPKYIKIYKRKRGKEKFLI